MTKFILIILTITLFACNNKHVSTFVLPESREINNIVEAIIYQDSLPVFKKKIHYDTITNNGGSKTIQVPFSIPLSVELKKNKLETPDIPPPSHSSGESIDGLLNVEINGRPFFSNSDSLYIIFQNDIPRQFFIDKIILEKLNVTTFVAQREKQKTKRHVSFYYMTIPIFSKDNKRAYVELTHACSGLCGSSTAFYLEKINDRWTIIDRRQLWIS